MSSPAVPPAAAEDALPVIRVGGVPEHFNMPWFLAQEQSLYSAHGLRFEWREYKLGTGDMIRGLKAGEIDVIVALTEGLVSDIAQGSDLALIGTYVESPLTWAISTGPTSDIEEVADLRGRAIGISRFTSGSHLMSCVLASQRGWSQSELSFVVEGSFELLRKSLVELRTAAFMWETFMTKPFHDSGEIRRIGEIVTPWPCFMLASRRDYLAHPTKRAGIANLLQAIQESCRRFKAAGPAIAPEIARRYGLREVDAAAWYGGVNITGSQVINEATLETALHALRDAGILTSANYPREKQLDEFIDTGLVELGADIKSMRLYHKPELLTALFNNIRVRLQKERGPLTYEALLPYDQNHYGSVAALDTCVRACALTKGSRVVQLGSSVGGPARYLAGAIGCEVLAVELQEDLHSAACELTHRCALDSLVHHLAANWLNITQHLAPASYDCIASWLTLLHFDKGERERLYRDALRILKPGGILYAEDFCGVAESGDKALTPDERRILRHDVWCKYLPPSPTAYAEELKAAGFEVELQDITPDWKVATSARTRAFEAARAEEVAVHGEEVVGGLASFYTKISQLFAGDHCAGVRVIAKKPLQ